MMAETVRIKLETHAKLRDMAARTRESLQEVLDKAVEAYHRKQFLAECNRAYQSLKSDRKAWAEEIKERELWEATLLDGLGVNER